MGYWYNLKILYFLIIFYLYDVTTTIFKAAGALIVREAGGVCLDTEGKNRPNLLPITGCYSGNYTNCVLQFFFM